LPRKLVGSETIIHTRRPQAWAKLSQEDAAMPDFLRQGGATSELSPEETILRTLKLLLEDDRFEHLLKVAATEPPRVRAILGAIGEQLGNSQAALQRLRDSLNPSHDLTSDLCRGCATPENGRRGVRMKLFEHPDFTQAILQAAEHFRERGLSPAIIEKDYYVTEALRIVSATAADWVIFKGGTSLSKGLESDRAVFRRNRHFSRPTRFSSGFREERHRSGTQETSRRGRRAPGARVCREREPDHRWIRAERSIFLYAAIRRSRRSGKPGSARSRYRERS
jgi:hypothetical protein